MMRKIFYLVTLCILVMVIAQTSHVTALPARGYLDTEWVVFSYLLKFDNENGENEYRGASVGGRGIMRIGESDINGVCVLLLDSDFESGFTSIVGNQLVFVLSDYTSFGRKIKATSCFIQILDPQGDTVFTYTGSCDAKLKITGRTNCSGTVWFQDTETGAEKILSLSGWLIGQHSSTPPPIP